MTREELKALLKEKEVNVTFHKVSGEVRKMRCTLKEGAFPAPKGVGKKIADTVLPVWDLDKAAWRSFRIDSVTEVEEVN